MTKVDLRQSIREVLGSIDKKILSRLAGFGCEGGGGRRGGLNESAKKKNDLFSM